MKFVSKESFFGSKSKHHKPKELKVHTPDCLKAIQTHVSPYGRLRKAHGKEFRTTSHDHYQCKRMKTKTREYFHCIITAYEAHIVGR